MDTESMRDNAGEAAGLLKSLANANRLMILCHLVKGEKCVSELVKLVGVSQSALSQHLARLRDEKLVDVNREGQMAYYRIADPKVAAILSALYGLYCEA